MPKVLQCLDWDAASQVCNAQAWADQASWIEYLPTVEQAGAIGGLMLLAVGGICAAGLLIPEGGTSDE